jgi:hypothetical protein
MPKNKNDDDDIVGDQYEGMSDDDRAWMEEMDDKRQREDDALAEHNRQAEFDRNSRDDEDDKRDNDD